MERAAEEGDEEEVDDGEAEKTAEEDLDEERSPSLCIHYPCIAEPFAGGAGEYPFKQSVIYKYHPKKEPAESISRVIPVDHIPVPCFIRCIGQQENQQGVYQKIQHTRAFANLSHAAKVGRIWGLVDSPWNEDHQLWPIDYGLSTKPQLSLHLRHEPD